MQCRPNYGLSIVNWIWQFFRETWVIGVLSYGQNRKNAIARNRVSYNRKKKTGDCKSKICQESCLIRSVCFVIQMMIVVFDFNSVIRNGKFCDGTVSWTVFGRPELGGITIND